MKKTLKQEPEKYCREKIKSVMFEFQDIANNSSFLTVRQLEKLSKDRIFKTRTQVFSVSEFSPS
jgi:hypothetical protein